VLGSVGGLIAKYDGQYGYLDVELSVISLDPSSMFIAAIVSLPFFVLLRLLSQAFEEWQRDREHRRSRAVRE
jgi:hypothetical protein